jgi:hypothetical protein
LLRSGKSDSKGDFDLPLSQSFTQFPWGYLRLVRVDVDISSHGAGLARVEFDCVERDVGASAAHWIDRENA